MNAKNEVSKRIIEARVDAGLTQSDVAKYLDISPQSVQQWENGSTSPRGKRVQKLAELLKTSAQFLVFGTSTKNKIDSNSEKGINADSLNDAIRESFKKTIFDCADIGWISVRDGVNLEMLADIAIKNLKEKL